MTIATTRRMRQVVCTIAVTILFAATALPLHATTGNSLTLERVVDVGVGRAVYATHSPDPLDANKLFTVHQDGQIRIVDLSTNTVLPEPFLTVQGNPANESGLVGLAFHPNYAENGRFFINRHDGSRLRVEEYRRGATSDIADPNLVRPIWTHTLYSIAHNAGWIGFNPIESANDQFYLWRTLGDGGGPGGGATPGSGEANNFAQHDPQNRAQTLEEPHGHIIRIDVGDDVLVDEFADTDNNYAIPPDNPFVLGPSSGVPHEQGHETYARGLRHPWRASFDRETGDFYIGEVSQDIYEEINIIPQGDNSGLNFGWRLRDGTIESPTEWIPPVGDRVGGPEPPNHAAPIYQYWHDDLPNYIPDPNVPQSLRGNSVTGGFVYRGPVAALDGYYFFGDFVPGKLWSIAFDGSNPSDFDGENIVDLIDWNSDSNTLSFTGGATSLDLLAGFGEDQVGNVYLVRHSGEILRIADASISPLISGNFDFDGDVDGNDFLKWQRGESPDSLSSSRLAEWKLNFGFGDSPLASATKVPEPASYLLLFLMAICSTALRNRCQACDRP